MFKHTIFKRILESSAVSQLTKDGTTHLCLWIVW